MRSERALAVAGAQRSGSRSWCAEERVDATEVARSRKILSEAVRARFGIGAASEAKERVDRHHLALLNERPFREAARVLVALLERRGGIRCERLLRGIEERDLRALGLGGIDRRPGVEGNYARRTRSDARQIGDRD